MSLKTLLYHSWPKTYVPELTFIPQQRTIEGLLSQDYKRDIFHAQALL